MGKQHEKCPFEDNQFTEDLLDWAASPQGQQSVAVSDVLWNLVDGMQLDAQRRQFVWPDGDTVTLDQSITRILKQYPEFPPIRIERFLVSWLENHVPEGYSEQQLDELDQLVEQWLNDLACGS